MRRFALFFALSLSAVGSLRAQETPQPESDVTAAQQSYVVQLSEYRKHGLSDTSRTAAEIVALLINSNGKQENEPVETIWLSTLSGTESTVQFGKRLPFAASTVALGKSISRQIEFIGIGTSVRVTATPKSGKVAIELWFETSRLDGERTADAPPDTIVTEISTTLLLEIGKPTLIGGVSASDSSYIVLTVTR